MLIKKNFWVDKVVIVKVASFVVTEVFVRIATQELKAEKTLVWFLLAAVKELLRPIPGVERFFVLAHNSKAVLQGSVLDLLCHLLV